MPWTTVPPCLSLKRMTPTFMLFTEFRTVVVTVFMMSVRCCDSVSGVCL